MESNPPTWPASRHAPPHTMSYLEGKAQSRRQLSFWTLKIRDGLVKLAVSQQKAGEGWQVDGLRDYRPELHWRQWDRGKESDCI